MEGVDLPAWLQGAAALIATAGTTWWLTFSERKKRREGEPGSDASSGQIVAATFTERAQMERLTAALQQVDGTLRQTNDCNRELIGLLRADAQRRHDEAVVRAALRERGIVE